MPTILRSSLAALVLGLPSACASAPWNDPAPGAPSEEVIEGPVEVVWDALPRVYSHLGLHPILEADGSSRFVSSELAFRIDGSIVGPKDAPLARCSMPPRAERTTNGGSLRFGSVNGIARIRVETRLVSSGEGTSVRTQAVVGTDGAASDQFPAQGGVCTTTGRLEAQISEGIRLLVSPPDSVSPSEDGEASAGGGPF